jgi:hypothetical protein
MSRFWRRQIAAGVIRAILRDGTNRDAQSA